MRPHAIYAGRWRALQKMKLITYIIIFISFISCSEKKGNKESVPDRKTYETEQKSEINKNDEISIEQTKSNNTTKLFSVRILKTKKDTLVDYNFLSQDFVISTMIEFNYPKLENKIFSDNYLVLSNDTIEVKIKEIKFDPSKHKLTYQDTLKVPKKYGLIKIDGKEYYGSDGEMPKTEIENIKIKYRNTQTELNSEYFKNLCNVGFNPEMTDVYIANNGQLILTFWASDGAGGYFATLIIKDGKLENKIIDYGF